MKLCNFKFSIVHLSMIVFTIFYLFQDILPYWPDSKEVLKAGQIKVRLASSDKLKNFEIRNLEITHSEVRFMHANSFLNKMSCENFCE